MKRPTLVFTIELLLFFVLVAGALLLLSPLSRRLENALIHFRDTVTAQVESSTGFGISYASLSPSIFSSLRITGLVITDAASGETVASLSNVTVSYDLFALMRGETEKALRGITIRNGSVTVDYLRNQALFERFSTRKKSTSGTLAQNALALQIRNIDISYTGPNQVFSGHIGKGLARIEGGEILFELESRIRYARDTLPGLGLLDAKLTVKGSVNSAFDTGSASLLFRNLEGDQFSVLRLGLLASFQEGIVTVSSVQDLQPVDIKVLWDIARKDLTASLSCERLLPLRLVTIKNDFSVFARLRDISVSGTSSVRITEAEGLTFSVNLKADVPDSFLQGATVLLKCDGTTATMNVENLLITGDRYDISYNGSLDLIKMLPEGFLSVKKLQIPSGTNVSGDMYINPAGRGFSCLLPTLNINDNLFTSVVVDLVSGNRSLEFTLSAYDDTGHIGVDGTYTLKPEPFLELYCAFDSVSVADTVRTVSGLLGPKTTVVGSAEKNILTPYAMTTELYFATDFSSLSFNCNRLVLASSERDGLYVLLSAKGNEKGIDFTDISFSYAGYDIAGTVHTGFDSPGTLIFDSAFTINSIPYVFSGLYSSRQLSLYGDYKFGASLSFDNQGAISGSLTADGLPVPAGKLLLSLSINADFTVDPASGLKISLNSGTVQDTSGFLPVSTVAGFKGSIDRNGIFLENLTLSDELSRLSGNATIQRIEDTDSIKRYDVELQQVSAESGESWDMNGRITFAEKPYFEVEASVKDGPLARFLKNQEKDNLASFTLSCSGTLSDLYVSANVERIVYKINGFDLDARGKLLLQDRRLTIFDAAGSWNTQGFSEMKGSVLLDTLDASIESRYNGVLGKSGLSAGLTVVFSSDDPEKNHSVASSGVIPDLKSLLTRFSVKATISDITWNSIVSKEPLICTFMHEPGITAFYAGKNDSVTGFLLDDGTFSLQSGKETPVTFHADGLIKNQSLSVTVAGLHTDLAQFWPYTGLKIVEFGSGSLDGDMLIEGLISDPDFFGELKATDISVKAPGFLEGTYNASVIDIRLEGKTLTVPPFVSSSKEGSFTTEAVLQFDRWVPSTVELKTTTLPGQFVRLGADNALFKALGYASFDLMLGIDPDGLKITGNTGFERGFFAILFSGFTRQVGSEKTSPVNLKMNLSIAIGKKVEFRWPSDDIPIIRGLIQADKPIEISLDTAARSFQLKGEANLKGGELFYIKRNFYLRQGNISFNENQDIFDPMITVRAEIRERDTQGEPVRIILSVENQPLSSFMPVLRSDPPKSDAEIMSLLGQAASGDTSRETILRNTVITASDIFTQMSLFRAGENKVRDLLGLDLFSVRTLILQNAILGPAMQTPTDAPMTIGNYFDDTTVYMGKYLGSAIYADALMHFSYYDPKSVDNTGNAQGVFRNLLFQPELGLEVATPFFLLRWGFTPTSPKTLFVADNSVTLSWKFSY